MTEQEPNVIFPVRSYLDAPPEFVRPRQGQPRHGPTAGHFVCTGCKCLTANRGRLCKRCLRRAGQ